LRYALSELDFYKTDIEALLSEHLGAPVSIVMPAYFTINQPVLFAAHKPGRLLIVIGSWQPFNIDTTRFQPCY
jgi:glycerol-3-phosphate dehydrogenase